jgi:hypothetical protein
LFGVVCFGVVGGGGGGRRQGKKNLAWRLANILLCFLFIKPT